MHIPDDPQYYEKFYFTPGDLGFRAWDTQFGRIGVLICWDQWYPEAARLTALSGAQILFYPTAIGWLPAEKQEHGAQQQAAWETIQRSHAIANGVYVCAVNRVGHEGDPEGRHRVLGRQLRLRPRRPPAGEGRHRRRDPHRHLRPVQGRCQPHPLALPAGPADRRLSGHHEAVSRLIRVSGHRERSEGGHVDTGFRMPAEWEPHRGTWLSWPHKEASWPGKFGAVPPIFARMVRLLAEREEVHVNVAGPAMEADVRRLLADEGADTGNVFFHHHPTNDAWCRDHGPIFVHRQERGKTEETILDWGYNAWGGKYPPYDLDDVIPTRIGREYGIPVVYSRDDPGRRFDRRERPWHASHDRSVPPQPQPESPARPRRHRGQASPLPRRQQHPLAG